MDSVTPASTLTFSQKQEADTAAENRRLAIDAVLAADAKVLPVPEELLELDSREELDTPF